MSVEQISCLGHMLGIDQRLTCGSGRFYAIFSTGKAGGLQILRCQWLAVNDYSFAIDALTLEPSDVCNNGVNTRIMGVIPVSSVFF